MKTLYLIAGAMGVGKSAVCREMKRLLPNCVLLDGDWCWDMSPFQVTDETKSMVQENIGFMLQSFLRCSAFENVVFCWVMHRRAIIDDVLSRLDVSGCKVRVTALVCDERTLRRRLESDVDARLREPDVIERGVSYLPLYSSLGVPLLDTTALTPLEAAELIIK